MGQVRPRVGLGRFGSDCVGLCGSPGMIQNVTVNVTVNFTFSKLLVLLTCSRLGLTVAVGRVWFGWVGSGLTS